MNEDLNAFSFFAHIQRSAWPWFTEVPPAFSYLEFVPEYMTTDLTVTGLTGAPSVAMRDKSWPSMENWIPHTVHIPPTRRSLNLLPLSTHTSLYGTGDPVCWPGASCDIITECWLRLQRCRHGNSCSRRGMVNIHEDSLPTFVPGAEYFWMKTFMVSLTAHKHILECCLNTHRSLLISYLLQSVIILTNNTATWKKLSVPKCVSAAYHVRKDLDIFRKTFYFFKANSAMICDIVI